GARDHISYDCPLKNDKCFNCGKLGHKAEVYRATKVFCFNCGEEGHKSLHAGSRGWPDEVFVPEYF
ncbi:cellular nucleic acid-binding protein, partial [Trifolium medium]|nr:cellular nucleic acid-binding protein [Trifolium medium]